MAKNSVTSAHNYLPPRVYTPPRAYTPPISRRLTNIKIVEQNPTIGPPVCEPLVVNGKARAPFGRVKVLYDRIMNRKHKMIKKYGLTLRSLRLDKDIFKQYMSNRAYYDMRTRMPKGWKKHLPMMYGFTAMNCGTNGEIPIKVRHIVLKKEVVNGFLYVKTIARYVMANRMYDYATGKIKTGGDWVEECRKLDEEVRTSPNRKSFKTESFIVDMETFECHKILWMKKEENLYKKLLTIKREPSILVTKEPTPAVNERTPLDRELFSL